MNDNEENVIGPYKGYKAIATIDFSTNIIYGKVLGISDLVLFEGFLDLGEFEDNFKLAIDDYLTDCKELNREELL